MVAFGSGVGWGRELEPGPQTIFVCDWPIDKSKFGLVFFRIFFYRLHKRPSVATIRLVFGLFSPFPALLSGSLIACDGVGFRKRISKYCPGCARDSGPTPKLGAPHRTLFSQCFYFNIFFAGVIRLLCGYMVVIWLYYWKVT